MKTWQRRVLIVLLYLALAALIFLAAIKTAWAKINQ
jgi:hypothetical protein